MSLRALAKQLGISTRHVDGLGREIEASDEALLTVMRALGVAIDSPADANRCMAERAAEPPPLVPPCMATRAWRGTVVQLHGAPESFFRATLYREDGQICHYEAQLSALPADKGGWSLALGALPIGYHRLRVACAAQNGECVILSAPDRAYGAPDGRREWGLFAPLYALPCDSSQGVGHYSALTELMSWADGLGASFVGTLPLLSADYEIARETSPYSPVSRLFWNELYLDLAPLIEHYPSSELDALLSSPHYLSECARLDALEYVDYQASSALKLSVLKEVSKAAWESDEDLLRLHLEDHPELHDYAQFRAAMTKSGKTWPQWPEAQRSGSLTAEDYLEEDYRYVVFAQWAVCQQLAVIAQERCKLYLDLSVGVSGSSYDVWRFQRDFVRGVDVGAPPDDLFTGGQNWALPPLHPQRARAGGHAYFARCVRNHMRYAGFLRIDHVMGLHRLYWVPSELGATEGVYVDYPADELYAILKIESHREQCVLVGEDLGTVPEGVRPAMEAAGMHRLYVAQFATEWSKSEHALGLQTPPANAIASLDTHDTLTFAGWLETTDLEVDAESLMRSWTEELARGPAAALMITLEDLWLEREPQNRPGTNQSVPNWRHRLALSLRELFNDMDIVNWLSHLNELRAGTHTKALPPDGVSK